MLLYPERYETSHNHVTRTSYHGLNLLRHPAASAPFRGVLSSLLPQRGAALEPEGLVRSLGVSGKGLWPSSWGQISGLLFDELPV